MTTIDPPIVAMTGVAAPALGVAACAPGLPGASASVDPALAELGRHFQLRALPIDAAAFADGAALLRQHPELCGYILMGDNADAVAAALRAADPLLPVERSDYLRDATLRESFVLRALTYNEWSALQRDGLSYAALQDFYSRRKYLLMSRQVATYQQLGPLLADGRRQPLDALAQQVMTSMMSALNRPASRGGVVNTLLHIRGYLKNVLSASEQTELSDAIEQYRRGEVSLALPLMLLRQHFAQHPNDYIEKQLFMRLL